jgi:hypothetical protein
MPPSRPPTRKFPWDYHFHVYDYKGSARWKPGLAQPGTGKWPFYSMREDLRGLKEYGEHHGVPNIGLVPVATSGSREVMVLSFGDNAKTSSRIVITGGIHAREWIAAEIAYLIAEYLIVNYPDPKSTKKLTPQRKLLKNLVDTRYIHIIPMVNPDGIDHTVFGNERDWRKNRRGLPIWGSSWVTEFLSKGGACPKGPLRNVGPSMMGTLASYDVPDYAPPDIPPKPPATIRNREVGIWTRIGVDLNRNMPTKAWGYDCAPDYNNWNPAGDTFFGTGPASENETKAIQQAMAIAANGANIDVAIDYHSYSCLILYPSETTSPPVSISHQFSGWMLQSLIRDATGKVVYQLGYQMGLAKYDATGTVADYAAQQHKARAFTIELDPPDTGQGLTGFALQEDLIQAVFENNIRGALAAIAAPQDAKTALDVVKTLKSWKVHGKGNQLP